MLLYKRKAHVHHYTDYIEKPFFDDGLASLDDLIANYGQLESAAMTKQPRMNVLFK
jgi:tubulin epsilon